MVTLGILSSEIFSDIILPFLLIFTIIFAILEKTKFLGEKKDIHAIVALVFGMISVGVPWAIGVITSIIPIVVIIIIILISWLMTYGFLAPEEKGPVSKNWRIAFQIILGIVFIGVIAWATGLYTLIINKPWASTAGQTLLVIGVVIAVISIVVSGGGKGKSKDED
jgi:peptidoglycan/LPS O-acetylase OafA/YrhL